MKKEREELLRGMKRGHADDRIVETVERVGAKPTVSERLDVAVDMLVEDVKKMVSETKAAAETGDIEAVKQAVTIAEELVAQFEGNRDHWKAMVLGPNEGRNR